MEFHFPPHSFFLSFFLLVFLSLCVFIRRAREHDDDLPFDMELSGLKLEDDSSPAALSAVSQG